MITRIDGTRQITPGSITNNSQNFGTPSVDTDVAIKSYVDSVAQGLSVKQSVVAATTSPLPANTYGSNQITANSNGVLTIDGYTPQLNDRLLINNEVSTLKNGIYTVTQVGTGSLPFILSRSVDCSNSSQFNGAFVFVEEGTVNSSSGWVSGSVNPNVGVDPITFVQFSGAGEILAGNGLSKVGNTLSIDTSITVDKNSAQSLSNKTLQSPLLVTPTLGVASGTSLTLSSYLNEAQATNIASATTTNIGAANGNYINITGTTTIVSFDVVQAGTRRILNFNGALILTYNGTSMILPGGVNITTAIGDTATFISLGGGNWVCTQYTIASLAPGQAKTVITNANLTGDITSVGNATTLAVYDRANTVSGTQDSVNKVFTIANVIRANSEKIFFNGQLLTPGSTNDYILSGTTLTFQSGFTAPLSTDVIRCYGVY